MRRAHADCSAAMYTRHRANSARLHAVTGAAGQLADNVLKVPEHLQQASCVAEEYFFDVETNATE
jgi:hypothetical protein